MRAGITRCSSPRRRTSTQARWAGSPRSIDASSALVSTTAIVGIAFAHQVIGPVARQVLLAPLGGPVVVTLAYAEEREVAWAVVAQAQGGLDRFARDLRDGQSAPSRLPFESGGEVVRQADRCAAHTCILRLRVGPVNLPIVFD